jgi:hypothetical protein
VREFFVAVGDEDKVLSEEIRQAHHLHTHTQKERTESVKCSSALQAVKNLSLFIIISFVKKFNLKKYGKFTANVFTGSKAWKQILKNRKP